MSEINATYAANLTIIQNDLARIEGLLPSGIVHRILDQTQGTLDESAVIKYKSPPLFSLRNGWLWYLLRKVLMPVRMMRRSMFGNSSGVTIPAVLYGIFLSVVWIFILSNSGIRSTFFFFVWAGIILTAISPYAAALAALLRNKTLYAGARHTFTGGTYYGEE